MAKVAVVFWSGTGNTEAMAEAVAEGATSAGAEVQVFQAAEFSADQVAGFDGIAFGCPAMGDEQLEEEEFEPMFRAVEPELGETPIALFGSYSWAEGQWMETWEEECRTAGHQLATASVIAYDAPDDEALEACRALGAALAK